MINPAQLPASFCSSTISMYSDNVMESCGSVNGTIIHLEAYLHKINVCASKLLDIYCEAGMDPGFEKGKCTRKCNFFPFSATLTFKSTTTLELHHHHNWHQRTWGTIFRLFVATTVNKKQDIFLPLPFKHKNWAPFSNRFSGGGPGPPPHPLDPALVKDQSYRGLHNVCNRNVKSKKATTFLIILWMILLFLSVATVLLHCILQSSL